jgi:hypothetical protein
VRRRRDDGWSDTVPDVTDLWRVGRVCRRRYDGTWVTGPATLTIPSGESVCELRKKVAGEEERNLSDVRIEVLIG